MLLKHWLLRYRRKKYLSQQSADTNKPVYDYLQAMPTSINLRFNETPFMVIDLETTSLDNDGDIISIGWVMIEHGAIDHRQSFHCLINNQQQVGHSATIHQIRDIDLEQGVAVDQAFERLLIEAKGRVLVFHHSALDLSFLNALSQRCSGLPFLAPVVDTLCIEKTRLNKSHELIPFDQLTLAACRQRYSLTAYSNHNAGIDALATAELLLAQFAGPKRQTPLRYILR